MAWNLVHAGRDVTVCAREPVDRLVLRLGDGEPVALPAVSTTSPAQLGRKDWVFVATKAQDTASAQPWLDAAAGPGTVIVLLQNGIDHASRLGRLPDGAAVLPSLVHINLEPVAPGQARQQDFRSAAWRKLLGNVAHNPILALTGRRADVFTEPDVLELAARLISEAAAVAAAEGVVISPQEVSDIVTGLGALPAGAGNSMLFDRLRGRALESEFLTGAVIRAGHAAGVPTPLNEAVLILLRAASRGVAVAQPGT